MGTASFLQDSFLGGEWSPLFQGRAKHPKYSSAMNVCLNVWPLEEGPATRRPGTRWAAHTRRGATGRVLPFSFQNLTPYTIELTNGHMRFFNGALLALNSDTQTVATISSDNPAVVTITGSCTWSTGDSVQFNFTSPSTTGAGAALLNRQFVITVLNAEQFTLADDISGAGISGASIGWTSGLSVQVSKVMDFTTPWNATQMLTVRPVQSNQQVILLQGQTQPYSLEAVTLPTVGGAQFPTFNFSAIQFLDGPYLNATPNAYLTNVGSSSGAFITVSVAYNAWANTTAYPLNDIVTYGGNDWISLTSSNINNTPAVGSTYWALTTAGSAFNLNTGAVATDVGRSIRIWQQPPDYVASTGYSIGNVVTYPAGQPAGTAAYYQCIAAATGEQPDINPTFWAPVSGAGVARWTWGIITSIVSPTEVAVNLIGNVPLYPTYPIPLFQMGAYSNTTGWPTCGCYTAGRLWLGGAVGNRVDASNSNDIFNFAPTATDGTVSDANAIAATFDSSDVNTIYWMAPDQQGILCGTLAAEWLVSSSTLQDPLTPTNTNAKRVTRYGCANIEPRRTGLSLVFVQAYQRRMLEMFADVFSGKYQAPNLTETSRHLTVSGIQELAYQEELSPIIWSRMGDGSLKGTTYRRTSLFASEAATFCGWHRHTLGVQTGDPARLVNSITVGPNLAGTLDSLTMVTQDGVTGVNSVEVLTDQFDLGGTCLTAWFLDSGNTPSLGIVSATGVTFYGYTYLNGKTATAWIGGLDCGDHLVTNGAIFVPFGSDATGKFTLAYLQSLQGQSFGNLATTLEQTITVTPAAAATNPTILGYNPSGAVLSGDVAGPAGAVVAWGTNTFYTVATGGTAGIRSYSLNGGGNLTGALFSTIDPTNGGTVTSATLGADGNIYVSMHTATANSVVDKISPSFTLLGTFGQNAVGLGGGNTALSMAPGYLASVMAGTSTFLVNSSTNGASFNFGVLNGTTMQWAAPPATVFANGAQFALLVAGQSGATQGTVYAVSNNTNAIYEKAAIALQAIIIGSKAGTYASGYPAWNSGTTYAASTALVPVIVSYKGVAYTSLLGSNTNQEPDTQGSYWQIMPNPYITILTAANMVTAAQLDPNGQDFPYGATDVAYDQTDGNLLVIATVGVGESDLLTKQYLFKMNSANGSLMWHTQLTAPVGTGALSQSLVQGGTLSLVAATGGTVYRFNTLTGTYMTYGATGIAGGAQFSNDRTGVLVSQFSSYTSGTNAPTPLGTTPSSFSNLWAQLGAGSFFLGTTTSTSSLTIPAVIGFTYTSQGQILRPLLPQDTGAQNGPSLGKPRRLSQYAALLNNSYGVSFGTDSNAAIAANLASYGGTPVAPLGLFSGVFWDTVNDDTSFDGQLGWLVTRPYPVTVAALEGFLSTQDR